MKRRKGCRLGLSALLLATCGLFGASDAFLSGQWIKPFDYEKGLRMLCTDNNHHIVMRGRESPLLSSLARHSIMCQKNFTQLLYSRRYEGLVWFMQSMGFCNINRLKNQKGPQQLQYRRDFQMNLLRAAFSLVCKRTDDIGRYHLSTYADAFRIIYEKENRDRREICGRATKIYEDLYRRCHVDEPEESPLELFTSKCDGINDTILQTKIFFMRFARSCDNFQEFYDKHYQANTANFLFGRALANDTEFMNGLGIFLKKAIRRYSSLPNLVLKTRLLLQHFPLATIHLTRKLQDAYRCKLRESNEYFKDENGEKFSEENATDVSNGNDTLSSIPHTLSTESTTTTTTTTTTSAQLPSSSFANFDYAISWGNESFVEENSTAEDCLNYDAAFYENLDTSTLEEFEGLASKALIGVYVEMCLLFGIVVNTLILALLLYQTRKQLSTATILFIFNILFSNALFVASFVCLYSDIMTSQTSYGSIIELSYPINAKLLIAETLQTHLYAPSEFLTNLTQETLFSLAQNGSLLGLTHLLVLVLVVINRSMSGKAIRLSKKYVISVFSLVWLFLIVSHVLFSALQYSAIKSLDQLFAKVMSVPQISPCNTSRSEFADIGEKCDVISMFHEFGVYLLRGHTLFTLCFLCTSIVVFLITFVCHWRVRMQYNFLGNSNSRENTPHRRRETLFNTLLLSIGAFFISVSGQSFIEIAVFWVDNRADVATLAALYQITRIAAFIDPLLNPILVAVRTPSIRRQLRFYFYVTIAILCALFCPWRSAKQWHVNARRRDKRYNRYRHQQKPSSASAPVSSTNHTNLFSASSRRASSATFVSTDSEITFRVLCTRQIIRTSIFLRSGSSKQNSVV